jgi:hypothetical protein
VRFRVVCERDLLEALDERTARYRQRSQERAEQWWQNIAAAPDAEASEEFRRRYRAERARPTEAGEWGAREPTSHARL